MALLYVLIGILLGWLIEWVIDWFYWRGRVSTLEAQLDDCRRSLLEEQERSKRFQLKISRLEEDAARLHSTIRDLETKLDKLTMERDAALQELQSLKAHMTSAQESKPDEKTSESPADRVDDLKKIEGIGPKIEAVLNRAGIKSFAALANTSAEKIREILLAAGSRFRLADPTTWPRQAKMASENRWEELQDYQDALNGGREG